MELRTIVREGYEKLSRTSEEFLKYVKENPDCFKRSNFQEIQWTDDPISPAKLQPWPIFISSEIRQKFKEASTNILALIRSIPQRIFANNTREMSLYFDLPIEILEKSLYGTDEKYLRYIIGRGDFVFSPSGLKCLEFNIASNFGGWEICIWQPIYLENPIISRFIKNNNVKILNRNLLKVYFGNFIDAVLNHFPYEDEINIVLQTRGGPKDEFAISMETYLNSFYGDVLNEKKQGKSLKGKVILASFSELDLKKEYLYYKNKKIHVVIEYIKEDDIPPEILILYKYRKVLLYNGPVNSLMNNKLFLALLSERQDSDIFTVQEKKIIKKYIPWTRKFRKGSTTYDGESVRLEDFALRHREKLILKPARGTAGKNVCIGYITPEKQWQKMISEALTGENVWVVQEYVESYPLLFQAGENGYCEYNVILGLFAFGSHYGGSWARLLPRNDSEGIISVSSGAQETIVLEIEE
jgi:hypothetical protein